MESQRSDLPLPEAQREYNQHTVAIHVAGGGETPPDLRQLMPEAVAGDETAIRTLHAITQAVIDRKLVRYAKSDADIDNIRGAVTEKMLGANFDPNWPLPNGTPPNQEARLIRDRYGQYIAKTIRSVIADSVGQRGPVNSNEYVAAAINTPPEISELKYTNGDGTGAISDELLATALTPDERTIFYMRREGMNGTKISQHLGVGLSVAKQRMAQVVQQLEKQILNPGGLYRIEHAIMDTDIQHAQVLRSIESGLIQAVKILQRWYVKTEWLAEMYPRENLIPLCEITDNATLHAFRRRYPERLIMHKGTTHISKHDIALVQELVDQKKQARTPTAAPALGYIALSDIACTAKESYRLRYGVRAGVYSNFIRHRRRFFVPETEARNYLAEIRSEEAPNLD